MMQRIVFDPVSNIIIIGDKAQKLGPVEYRIMRALVRVMPADVSLNYLTEITTSKKCVGVMIHKLRRKLQHMPVYISTARGHYSLHWEPGHRSEAA